MTQHHAGLRRRHGFHVGLRGSICGAGRMRRAALAMSMQAAQALIGGYLPGWFGWMSACFALTALWGETTGRRQRPSSRRRRRGGRLVQYLWLSVLVIVSIDANLVLRLLSTVALVLLVVASL
jgi:hypothetical protein